MTEVTEEVRAVAMAICCPDGKCAMRHAPERCFWDTEIWQARAAIAAIRALDEHRTRSTDEGGAS